MIDFIKKVKKICEENKKVAMFIDMDGTIAEYTVFKEGTITNETKGIFLNSKPIKIIIDELRKINDIENIDLYILTLAKSTIIVEEKKEWLRKYVDFIKESNWIIINKQKGEYSKENRNHIKADKIEEKLKEYDKAILLDDEHTILREAQKQLKDKCQVFHISSVIV